jgi:Holliday junction resolvase RusA-like endonuclease
MPRWNEADLRAYEQRRSHDPDTRIRPDYTQPVKGNALECPVPRKEKSGSGAVVSPEPRRRCKIQFTIYAVRPCDWDGWSVKEIQDCCVHAGLLDDDKWDLLYGTVISAKAHTKEEERTIIEIEQL